jgi:hypothetical protein
MGEPCAEPLRAARFRIPRRGSGNAERASPERSSAGSAMSSFTPPPANFKDSIDLIIPKRVCVIPETHFFSGISITVQLGT